MILHLPIDVPVGVGPFLLLMGRQHGWQIVACRMLDKSWPAIVATHRDAGGMTYLEALELAAEFAATIAIWASDVDWEWIEWGAMVRRWPSRVLIGCDARSSWDHVGHLLHVAECAGCRCFSSMDDLVSAAAEAARGVRCA